MLSVSQFPENPGDAILHESEFTFSSSKTTESNWEYASLGVVKRLQVGKCLFGVGPAVVIVGRVGLGTKASRKISAGVGPNKRYAVSETEPCTAGTSTQNW